MKKLKRILCIILSITMVINAPILKENRNNTKADVISTETEWNIKTIKAEKSYEESRNYKKIKVAVLDSGVDYDETIPVEKSEDFLDNGCESKLFNDMTGHGTSVSSIICAKKNNYRVSGIAANVELYSGRILDENNESNLVRVIRAIRWAISEKVDIIHLSFGTKKYSRELEDIINNAYKNGILVVAAAGNNGDGGDGRSTIEYPACFENVVSVGATNKYNGMSESSSKGAEMDVVAPGEQILATGPFWGVCVTDGTSIAAAQVTGLAAVLWGRNPDKSNEFIKGLLVGTANSKAVQDNNCGNGMVDYNKASQEYNEFSKTYEENKKAGDSEKNAVREAVKKLPDNTSKVAAHPEVNYVSGSWKSDMHEEFVEGGSNLSILKKATVITDKNIKYYKLGTHPEFHGGDNYYVNTQYMMALAKEYKKTKKVVNKLTVKKINKYGTKIKKLPSYKKKEKKIAYKMQSSKLKDIFSKCGAKTAKEKSIVILGMAIHNMTDAYTHNISKRFGVKNHYQYIKVIHPVSKKLKGKKAVKWQRWSGKEYSYGVKENYKYLYKNYAIADNEKKLSVTKKIAKKVAKAMISDYKEEKKEKKGKKGKKEKKEKKEKEEFTWYKTAREKFKDKVKNNSFRLNDEEKYWASLTGEKKEEGKKNQEMPEIKVSYMMDGSEVYMKIDTSPLVKYDVFEGKKSKKSLFNKKPNYTKKNKNILKLSKKKFHRKVNKLKRNGYTIIGYYGEKRKVKRIVPRFFVYYHYTDENGEKKIYKQEVKKNKKNKLVFDIKEFNSLNNEKWFYRESENIERSFNKNQKNVKYIKKKFKKRAFVFKDKIVLDLYDE